MKNLGVKDLLFSVFTSDQLALEELVPLALALGAAAWMDYDNDGWLDFAVCGSSFTLGFSGSQAMIYRNVGEGGFELAHHLLGVQMGDDFGFQRIGSQMQGNCADLPGFQNS